jgi:glycine cleavage system H protein
MGVSVKEIEDLNFPAELRYGKDHGWVRSDGDLLIIGISDYAQDQLGDVVYVGLPEPDTDFAADQEYGSVESVKTVSELIMPVTGTISAVNTALEDTPELVNSDPYGQGWILKVKPDDPAEPGRLMDSKAYLAMLKG